MYDSYMDVTNEDHSQITVNRYTWGDAVSLMVGYWTCDFQAVGSSPGWAPFCSGLAQATYTCVPLSPSSIIWYWPRVDLFGWESNHGPGGK